MVTGLLHQGRIQDFFLGVPSLAMHRPVLHNKVPLSRGVWGLGI